MFPWLCHKHCIRPSKGCGSPILAVSLLGCLACLIFELLKVARNRKGLQTATASEGAPERRMGPSVEDSGAGKGTVSGKWRSKAQRVSTRDRTTSAGFPWTTFQGGTDFVTTLPAVTMLCSPTVTPGPMKTREASQQPRPMRMGALR